MIKKLLVAALVAVPMCLSAQTFKFGTVNSQEVFEALPDKAAAEESLKAVQDKYQAEYDKLQEEFRKKYQEFQELPEDTPQSIKDSRMQELSENNQKIQNFQQVAAQDLQKQQEALLAPITAKIQSAIQAVGQEGGYTFIYDLSIPTIVYIGAGAEDVTAQVKAKLGI